MYFCCASNQKIKKQQESSQRYMVGSLNPIKLCNLRFRILLEWSEHGKTLTQIEVRICSVHNPLSGCSYTYPELCLVKLLDVNPVCAQRFCYCKWLLSIFYGWCCCLIDLWECYQSPVKICDPDKNLIMLFSNKPTPANVPSWFLLGKKSVLMFVFSTAFF